MSDRRFRLDLASFGVFLVGLVVALCVLSHDPTAAKNLLGPPGMWLAGSLLEALGFAVYLLLASWFVLVVMLWMRRSWVRWSVRLVGWLLLLPWAAAVADLLSPYLPDTFPDRGGTLGAWLALRLQEHFSGVVQAIILTGILLFGLFLGMDRGLLRGFRIGWRLLRWHLSAVGRVFRWLTVSHPSAAPVSVPRTAKAVIPIPDEEPEGPEEPLVPGDPEDEARSIPINHHNQVSLPSDPDFILKSLKNRLAPVPSEADRFADYALPELTLLEEAAPFPHDQHDQHLRDTATLLEKTFKDFSLNVRVVGINTGPVVTQYEIALETGLRVNKVTNLGDDLALNLKVPSVRIVAPIPGKNTVGIEVPNEHRAVVRLKEVLLGGAKKAAKMRIPLYLGKDTEGRPLVNDLAEMPHLLIAGRTGTGKSVCLNSIILSMLMTRRPDEVKMIMIDPKQVELSEFARIPHLMSPIVTDMKKAEAILAWAVDKMEERYDLLARARVRNIAGYNELTFEEIVRRVQPGDEQDRDALPKRIPYIVIIIDELADLMMLLKKEVETHIIRLAQKSRAAGIHLVVATQKPTVDVITGLIKSNLPARICFQVSSRSDSRVVLDEMGADKLLGKGDMLFLPPGTSILMRAQGTYLSDAEIRQIVGSIESDPCYAEELIRLKTSESGEGGLQGALRSRDDELYEAAIELVIREGRGSVSLLQRALGIGYGRAARLIDFMAEDGVVGAYNGSNAREVLLSPADWEGMKTAQQS